VQELSSEVLAGVRGLRVLDLRENKLDELPDDITLLQMLERLDLANNTLSRYCRYSFTRGDRDCKLVLCS
jgi:Leucine-rich repeat (LRR) protein